MVVVNDIVNACIRQYNEIQKTGKPTENEWTVLSAVVGVFNDKDIQVLSLGTGSKCIGKSSMSSNGDILNDSHSEVIARRSFIKYLYLKMISLNETKKSEVLCYDGIHFKIRDSVKFYFVTSTLPCGDATIMPKSLSDNMDLELAGECLKKPVKRKSVSQSESDCMTVKRVRMISDKNDEISSMQPDEEEQDIHRTGAKCLPNSEIQDPHFSGINYHRTGAVRTKPGRGDPTLSVSCSDKIARWNAIGWQGALINLFIKEPIFMEAIICLGGSPFSKESFDRAINERIQKEIFTPIHQSDICFSNRKSSGKRPSPLSLIWSRTIENPLEVSVHGRKQGVTRKNLKSKRARTSICKKELFLLFRRVVESLPEKQNFLENLLATSGKSSFSELTYGELKASAIEYYKKWENVKRNCFKIWTEKPGGLLNFTLCQE